MVVMDVVLPKQEVEEMLSESCCLCDAGYGFVDFDSPAAAQKAVSALKTNGVQAQMAKVGANSLSGCVAVAKLLTALPSH